MLDIPRLERIKLSRHPFVQRCVGWILMVNFRLLPGIRVHVENEDRLPPEPVIFAMNHTDRYNYFPFYIYLWRRHDRFVATWVKGKYYEHWFTATFMEKTNQLPTVSRGYLITRDFVSAVGRRPDPAEYEAARDWLDAASRGESESARPEPGTLPDALLSEPRNVLGRVFEPDKEDWATYLDDVFHIMMRRFVALNEQAARVKLDLNIFPQGTRSIRLLPGHIGISQIALHLRLPIVPVGCNGSDHVYPSSSPWGKRADVTYRIGEPIPYDSIPQFHVDESYEPFSPAAEERHREKFQGLADLVTDRIEGLLDEPYRRAPDGGWDATKGSDRFM